MRKLLAATLSVLLTATLLLVAPNSAEAAKKKFKLSIASSAYSITVGEHFTISGRITPAVAGKAITIKKKVGAGGRWYGTTKVYTAADGSYTFDAAPPQLGKIYYRVYTAKQGKYKANYSKTISVTVKAAAQQPATVTITGTGSTNITINEDVVVKGTTSANLVGKTVTLASLDGTTWNSLSSTTVAADSTFSISVLPNGAGAARKFKVISLATSTTAYAESDTLSFNVYGWSYLSELTKLENMNGEWSSGAATVNGKFYGKSVLINYSWVSSSSNPTPTSVQFDLGRKCLKFVAALGWADDASSGAVLAAAKVYKDGALVDAATRSNLSIGTTSPIQVDVSGTLRLKVEAQRLTANSKGKFVFGDAQILCAF